MAFLLTQQNSRTAPSPPPLHIFIIRNNVTLAYIFTLMHATKCVVTCFLKIDTYDVLRVTVNYTHSVESDDI